MAKWSDKPLYETNAELKRSSRYLWAEEVILKTMREPRQGIESPLKEWWKKEQIKQGKSI